VCAGCVSGQPARGLLTQGLACTLAFCMEAWGRTALRDMARAGMVWVLQGVGRGDAARVLCVGGVTRRKGARQANQRTPGSVGFRVWGQTGSGPKHTEPRPGRLSSVVVLSGFTPARHLSGRAVQGPEASLACRLQLTSSSSCCDGCTVVPPLTSSWCGC
jgi:hypothetical protein